MAGPRFVEMLGDPGPTLTGLVTAVYDIGCAIGAVAAFLFGEQIGRKKSIIIANVIGKSRWDSRDGCVADNIQSLSVQPSRQHASRMDR